jgi:hypothetical protein
VRQKMVFRVAEKVLEEMEMKKLKHLMYLHGEM